MLNKRCSEILINIINESKPIMIENLCVLFHVSNRTIRYDLDKIDDYLKSKGMSVLIRRPNYGIQLKIDDKRKVLDLIYNIDTKTYVLSQEERVKIILYKLLQERSFTTLEKLSEFVMVSRSTIIKDINIIRKWLKMRNLHLDSFKRYGVKISGNEKYLRSAVIELLTNSMIIYDTLDIVKLPCHEKVDLSMNHQIKKLFDDIDIKYIENCVKMAEEQLDTIFSDNAYSALVMHIAIALKRIQLGKDIIMQNSELKTLQNMKEFVVSSSLAQMLENHFKIDIPIEEIGYITIHLLGSNVSFINCIDKDNWVETELMVKCIIKNVQEELGFVLIGDKQLFNGLLQHIKPAIYRLKHDLKLKNPLLEEIKEQYKNLFNIVKKSISFIESKINKTINDEEIGYLTLHFGAVLERINKRYEKRLNVIVVCATGIGTAKFVSSKLQSLFDANIVNTVSYHQIDKFINENKIDLVVTTIPVILKNKNIKVVEVNPFLTEKNINELSTVLGNLKNNYTNKNILLDKVIDVIKQNCTITNYDNLKNELGKCFNINNNDLKINKNNTNIGDLINEDCIKLGANAATWEEAIRIGGSILKKKGCVTDNYINAMINNVKNIGTYIVILPGIAMPHANPNDGVNKIGISFTVLNNPIVFGNPDNDPVKLVVCICAIDHSSHMRALYQLMNLLENKNFFKLITTTKYKRNIVKYIQMK